MDDNWTVKTADHSLAAHYEHTVAITEDGYEIMTKVHKELIDLAKKKDDVIESPGNGRRNITKRNV